MDQIQMVQVKVFLERNGFVSDEKRSFDTYTPVMTVNGRRYEVTTYPPPGVPSLGNSYAWVPESELDGWGVVGDNEESARELAMQMVGLIPAVIEAQGGTA